MADQEARGALERAVMRARQMSGDRYVAALQKAFPTDPKRKQLLMPPGQHAAGLTKVDLRWFMSAIEDQGPLMSCTAHAVTALLEYLQIATKGSYLDSARLFLYKVTRDLAGISGDGGAYIRSALKALDFFGCCPEEYCPYAPALYDDEPDPFLFALASQCRNIIYYRVRNLTEMKQSLSDGYPVAFGFTCYESLDNPEVAETGIIPYPVDGERAIGGHAVLAVGYLDGAAAYQQQSKSNSRTARKRSTAGKGHPEAVDGYVIIRNSWGPDWGIDGYGLLPYEYFGAGPNGEDPLADDLWTLIAAQLPELPGTHAAPYRMVEW